MLDQENKLRRFAEERGAIVVAVVSQQISGTDPVEWLWWAAVIAKLHNAVILAESVDRLVRPHEYHSVKRPHARPTKVDLVRLRVACDSVPLMTVVDPDAPLSSVRSFHTKRGQSEKCKKGGRPRSRPPGYKKKQSAQRMSAIFELLYAGFKRREIAAVLQMQLTQVQRFATRIRDGELRTHFLTNSTWFTQEFLVKPKKTSSIDNS